MRAMLDLNFVTDNLDLVAGKVRARGAELDFGALAHLNEERKRLQTEISTLRHEHQLESKRIAGLMKEGKKTEAEELRAKLRQESDAIQEREERLKKVEEECQAIIVTVPNLPHESVPVGLDETGNVEVRQGRCAQELLVRAEAPLGHRDRARHPRLRSGGEDFRGAVRRALGAGRASFAGAHPIHARPPHPGARLSRDAASVPRRRGGSLRDGQLPKFESDLFKVEGRDLYLVPTAEVPLTNLHRDEVLEPAELPKHYTAYTPCFRSEAGSYGKDVRGLIRQHQFDKVELVKITDQESSFDELESLTRNAEEVLKRLGASLPRDAPVHRRHGFRVGEDL